MLMSRSKPVRALVITFFLFLFSLSEAFVVERCVSPALKMDKIGFIHKKSLHISWVSPFIIFAKRPRSNKLLPDKMGIKIMTRYLCQHSTSALVLCYLFLQRSKEICHRCVPPFLLEDDKNSESLNAQSYRKAPTPSS